MSGVDEVVHPLLAAVVRLALGHLIVVVRELQITASTVNIHAVPEHVAGHHRALDMPPWPPGSPWGRPAGLPGFRLFPQSEVVLMPLLTGHLGRQRTLTFRDVSSSSLASRGNKLGVVVSFLEVLRVKVDRPVRSVCKAFSNRLLDEINNIWDVLRDSCQHISITDLQGPHILKPRHFEASRVLLKDCLVCDGVPKLLVDHFLQQVRACSVQSFHVALGGLKLGNRFTELRLLQRILLDQRLTFLHHTLLNTSWQWLRQLSCLFLELGLLGSERLLDVGLQVTGTLVFGLVVSEELVAPGMQDDLVIDIRDVHLVEHRVPKIVLQHSSQNVEGQGRTCMAHVRHVVDGGAADIHADLLPIPGNKKVLVICQ
mmetsp:Transcript_38830/g.93235  ORF Transcript_38830/g.93235 Transcript_38830/m.93235 type:complete len:371 (-) Transcript_38830:334-1446(-)